ncbi:hypothetical protein DERP_003826 [Dermatophagoides pteronyssinus]|uniref:Uncharacterized protein n=1 Tax=Dermatophagoides pteronyssinus TaxID=6956 RepID=A0ABQ8JLQ5_DERPT|nr:hypothetical protein DERP_003826 [Dermatophagoides pteronyssinus]
MSKRNCSTKMTKYSCGKVIIILAKHSDPDMAVCRKASYDANYAAQYSTTNYEHFPSNVANVEIKYFPYLPAINMVNKTSKTRSVTAQTRSSLSRPQQVGNG